MKIHFRQFFRLRDTFVRIVNKYEKDRGGLFRHGMLYFERL